MKPKSILIFVIILFALFAALSVVSYLSSVKNIPPVAVQPTEEPTVTPISTPEPTVTPTPTPNMNINSWKTYRNDEIGLEFKYPEILGSIEVTNTDNTNFKSLPSGKKIDIFFKKNGKYDWLYFTAFTPDYKGFKEFITFGGNDNIISECPKPLSYNEKGEACKIIEIAGEKAIWKNFFIEDECVNSFGSQVYFNNKAPSIYKGLQFIFYLEDAEAKVTKLYDCTDSIKLEQSNAEAVVQSKNIMERKNLSEKDLQRLDMFDKILASFKFIK